MLMKKRKGPLFFLGYFEAALAFENVKNKLKLAGQGSIGEQSQASRGFALLTQLLVCTRGAMRL